MVVLVIIGIIPLCLFIIDRYLIQYFPDVIKKKWERYVIGFLESEDEI